MHGFCVETASAGVILGVGLSKRLNAVNWNVAKRILVAWVLTIPASALVAYLTYQVLSPLLGK